MWYNFDPRTSNNKPTGKEERSTAQLKKIRKSILKSFAVDRASMWKKIPWADIRQLWHFSIKS